jgi:pimeloyl-ACP methyl ester carboxylesterase
VVGLSMGGFATLHFGLRYPERALSLVVGGCGYGAAPERREQFQQESEQTAQMIEREGSAGFAERYAVGAARVQFQNKDPRGWAEFRDQLAERPTEGSALTMRGVQKRRPSLWDLQDQMRALTVPTLIVTGDEDEPCLEPGLLMKRAISTSGLVVIPKSGHTINLEEPDAFNRCVQDFLTAVDAGQWGTRDPRSVTSGILGV